MVHRSLWKLCAFLFASAFVASCSGRTDGRGANPSAAAPAKAPPSSAEAQKALERARALLPPGSADSHGYKLASRSQQAGFANGAADGWLRSGTASKNTDVAYFAARASTRLIDRKSQIAITIAPNNASDAGAETAEGFLVYRDVLGAGSSIIHRPRDDGDEDFVTTTPSPSSELEYRVELGTSVAGLRLFANTVEFLDNKGFPRLRTSRPTIVDSTGTHHDGQFEIRGCAFDASPAAPWRRRVTDPGARACVIALRWPDGLQGPLLVDPTWSSTSGMNEGRSEGALTIFGDDAVPFEQGQALLAGGMSTNGPLESAELYADGVWAVTGSVSEPHIFPGFASVDGDTAVIGGNFGASSSTLETYSLQTGLWTRTSNTIDGEGAVFSPVPGVGVMITGGEVNPTTCLLVGTYGITTCPRLPENFSHHAAGCVAGSKVVIGGGDATSDAYIYDVNQQRWTPFGIMNVDRVIPLFSSSYAGGLFVYGGANAETTEWVPSDEYVESGVAHWYTTAAQPPTNGGALIALDDSRELLIGGVGSKFQEGVFPNPSDAAWIFNLYGANPSAAWQQTTSMSVPRCDFAAVLLSHGDVLVAGGIEYYGGPPLPSSEIYYPDYQGDGPCDDLNACTYDTVDQWGACRNAGFDACPTPSNNPCEVNGVCNPSDGSCTYQSLPDGTDCDDESMCTVGDTCSGGHCVGSALECPASTACELWSCYPNQGCVGLNLNNDGTSCDDNDNCTTMDQCAGGKCLGSPVTCPPAGVCQIGSSCDPVAGCVTGPAPDGTPCSDGTSCTVSDACSGGACVAVPGGGSSCQSQTVATDVGTGTSFLYTGSGGTGPGAIPPIQTPQPGQAALVTVLNPNQAGVIRGRVLAVSTPGASAAPLAGATVTVLGHVELGQTTTQGDGWFDLAVNAGGRLTVNVTLAGYMSVQRNIQTRWHQYSVLDDLVLTPLDSNANGIDLTAPGYTRARGSVMTDKDGSRQATLFFAPGTTATLVNTDGTDGATLSSLTVHATEFTVGDNGTKAMPGTLPPASAYTYAVELSADEVSNAGASGVKFSSSVPLYVENFLHFPIGTTVPSGYYDRQQGQWVATTTGVVLKLHSTAAPATIELAPGVVASAADLTAAGIPQDELDTLGATYAVGTELWRASVTHFTPYDLNQGNGPPPDTKAPPPAIALPADTDDPCTMNGSIIECENQILGEDIPLLGTAFTLHYQSDRTRDHAHHIHLKVTDAAIPADVVGVNVNIQIAGRAFPFSVPPEANQYVDMTWDGLDAYGRVVEGPTLATVGTGYSYAADYGEASSFGGGGVEAVSVPGRTFFVANSTSTFMVGSFDALPLGFGGWMLSDEHVYAPDDGYVFEGNGKRVTSSLTATVRDVIPGSAGLVASMFRVIRGADGAFYLGGYLQGSWAIVKVDTTGALTSIALDYPPLALAMTPQGLMTGGNGGELRTVNPDGTTVLLTAAGGNCPGSDCPTTPSVPLSSARFGTIQDMVTAPDGTLYVTTDQWLRRVGTDGMVTNVAGDGFCDVFGAPGADPGSVPVSPFSVHVCPSALALRQDGSILYAEAGDCRVFEIDPSQTQVTVVGGANPCDSGVHTPGSPSAITDFGDATAAGGNVGAGITSIIEGPDGTIYLGTQLGGSTGVFAIRPNDIVEQVVGSPGATGVAGQLAPDVANSPPTGMTLDGDGALIFTNPDTDNVDLQDYQKELRSIELLPGFQSGTMLIAEPDSNEVFTFNSVGQHLETQSWRTGALRQLLSYDDTTGQLTSLTDGGGNVTSVVRSGSSVIITAPFGQTTTISLDTNGYASSIANSGGQTWTTVHLANGLLTSLTDPKLQEHTFEWTDDGLLTEDSNPAGGFTTLSRTLTDPDNDGWTTTTTTAAGVTKSIVYSQPAGSANSAKTVTTGGLVSTSSVNGATETAVSPDGTSTVVHYAADPRFGASGRYVASTTITPGTPVPALTVTETRGTPTLSTPGNPFSLQSETDTITVAGQAYKRALINGNTVTVTSPTGRQSQIVYDAKERVQQVSYPGTSLATDTYSYNDAACGATSTDGCGGRIASVTASSGTLTRTTAFHYPTAPDTGFLASVVDSLGHTVSYTRYPNGLPSDVLLPDGTSHVGYTYDLNENVSSVTVPADHVHNFSSYDGEDDLVTYAPPTLGLSTESTTYKYDADQKFTSALFPWDTATRTLTIGRVDPLDRITSITDGVSSVTTSFSYDTGGRLGTASTPSAISIFSYAGSFLTNTTTVMATGSHTIGRTYDASQRLSQRAIDGLASATVGYTFDADSALTGITDSTGTSLFVIGRDFSGKDGLLATTSTVGEDVVTDAWTYDRFAEPMSYAVAAAGTDVYSVDVTTRDNGGRVVSKTETVQGTAHTYGYTYTALGQLATVTEDSVQLRAYGYDADGNRTTINSATVGVYDAQDRLNAYTDGSTAYSYAYTNDGELLSRSSGGSTTTYQYDLQGNLVGVGNPDGTSVLYGADAFGHRVSVATKDTSGTITQERGFLYDSTLLPVAELDATGAIKSVFAYGTKANAPDLMLQGGTTYRIVSDLLGSVRLVVNTSTGAVAQELDYDEFGRVLTDTNPGFQPFGFAGGIYDRHTGFVRFGKRDYDPMSGRWVSKDPTRFSGGLNFYLYCGDDPVNCADITGTVPQWLYDLDDAGYLKDAQNFFAGVASGATFGLSDLAFAAAGIDNCTSSTAFALGSLTAQAISAAGQAGAFGIRGGRQVVGTLARTAYNSEQKIVVQWAKEYQQFGGATQQDADALIQLANEVGVDNVHADLNPGPTHFGGQPHFHIGPVDHILITP